MKWYAYIYDTESFREDPIGTPIILESSDFNTIYRRSLEDLRFEKRHEACAKESIVIHHGIMSKKSKPLYTLILLQGKILLGRYSDGKVIELKP